MRVNVIIATNRPVSNLIPVLESYNKQSYTNFSIIVVTEGELQSLMNICNQLNMENMQIYSVPEGTSNAGISRNYGLKYAAGEIILFSDDDMVLSPDFIAEHVESHKKQKHAIVRGLRYQKREDGSFYLPRWEQAAMKHWSSEKRQTAWAYFVTSNASVSSELLHKAGEFDPNFKWSGCEDTDLAYRLIKAGGKPVANAKAVNYHLGIDEMQSKFERRIDNFKYLQCKYPDDPEMKWFVRLTLRSIEQGQINQLFMGE